MIDLIKNGGWMMFPIILSSIVSMAIIVERFWTLQTKRIIPSHLLTQIWQLHKEKRLDDHAIRRIMTGSPLGRILAAGLQNRKYGREVMKDSIEEVGRQVSHELERYLTLLGSIASITPLLGLLGTVDGMIDVFSDISASGLGDPTLLSKGISEALVCTASGLVVAIPSLFFHRHFEGMVDDYVLQMEENALRLVDLIQGDRESV